MQHNNQLHLALSVSGWLIHVCRNGDIGLCGVKYERVFLANFPQNEGNLVKNCVVDLRNDLKFCWYGMIVTAEKTRERKLSLQIKSTKTSSSKATVMTLEMAKFFCWCRWSRNWHWMLVWLRGRDHRRKTTSCAARTVLLQHYRMPLLLISLQGCRTVGVSMIVALTLNVGTYGTLITGEATYD